MTRVFAAYAAPLAFGPKVEVASHLGSVSYKITYSAVGDAIVLGRVHYFKEGVEGKVSESLVNGGSITTANAVANVEVDFKGAATGSAVEGTINP